MKKNLNRGISMLLSVAMLISLLTVGAYAEGENTDAGTGTGMPTGDMGEMPGGDMGGGEGDPGGGEGGMAQNSSNNNDGVISVVDGEVTVDEDWASLNDYIFTGEDGVVEIDFQDPAWVEPITSGAYDFTLLNVSNSDVILRNAAVDLTVSDEVEGTEKAGEATYINSGTLNIVNCYLKVDGAGRYTIANEGTATTVVKSSAIIATGNSNGMTDNVSAPRSNQALGISGTSRSNFSIEQTQTYYYGSYCEAEGWAAMSTDSAQGSGLDFYSVKSTGVALHGGYGIYADTNCRDWLYGSELYSAEIGAIISNNGTVTIGALSDATEDALKYDTDGDYQVGGMITDDYGDTYYEGDQNSVIVAGRNDFQLHSPDMKGDGNSDYQAQLTISNTILETADMTDGYEINAGNTVLQPTFDYSTYSPAFDAYIKYVNGANILLKSTSGLITLNNVTTSSSDDVFLLSAMNSDGMSRYLKTDCGKGVIVNATDSRLNGDIVHDDYQRDMSVTLDSTELIGAVTYSTYDEVNAAWAAYDGDENLNWYKLDPATYITDTHATELTLKNDSIWQVTGDSELTSLTIDETSTITSGIDDAVVVLTVDGVETPIEAGTYTGVIHIGVVEDIVEPDEPDTFQYTDDNDASPWTWASKYIYEAHDLGYMTGNDDGSFRASSDLTRAEAVTIALAVKNVVVDKTVKDSGFSDANGKWYTPYVAAAKIVGITAGYEDGTFQPSASITRAEFVTMMLAAKGVAVDKTAAVSGFNDSDGKWYTPYITAAKDCGLTSGYEDGGFHPNDNITRAEAAVMAVKEVAAEEDEDVTIVSITYGEKYIETHATDNDDINSPTASSNVAAVELSNGETYEADEGNVLTLVIDGDQYDIPEFYYNKNTLPEGYSFEQTAAVNEHQEMAKFMNMTGNTAQYTFRSALYVDETGIVENQTIPALLTKATYDASGIKDGELNSYGAFFNGIIVNGTDKNNRTEFTISNMDITAMGDGANDFAGEGAVVFAEGYSDVTVENTVIDTTGVIRTATAVTDNGIMRINNSLIYAQETNDTQEEYDALVVPMMKRTPFALGLEGCIRATNVLGAGQGIYTDSLIVSNGWGVLSTDSGRGYDSTGTYALDVSNTTAGTGTIEVAQDGAEYFDTITVDGVMYGYTAGGSGYVAYADSGVWDKFDHVNFYGGNEVQIMASSTSSAFYTNSTLTSGHIGVMTQQNAGGTISIKDSTLKVGETGIQIKSGAANSGYTKVILDGVDVEFTNEDATWGGTLVELVESDDAGNPGNTTFTVNDTGDTATTDTATAVVDDSYATLANGRYEGNIWNNIYNKYQVLNVTLDGANLYGTISSSYGYHLNDDGTRMENGTILYADTTGNYLKSGVTDYAKIGAQYNVANKQVNNPINVTLTNQSVWNIVLADGTNGKADALYINDLTVGEGSSVVSETPVTIHVYGTVVNKGTIGENVTIVEEAYTAPSCSTNTFTLADYNSPANVATFTVVDEEGNPVLGAVKATAVHQYTCVNFGLEATGYDIVSVTADENGTLLADQSGEVCAKNVQLDEGAAYCLTMKSSCNITVVVKAQEQQHDGGQGGGPM